MIGTGYVGLVTGACFAEQGNQVICMDIDESKITRLKNGEVPIYEPGLTELVQRNTADKRLTFTTDLALALAEAQIVFLCLPTPPDEDGSADLHYVLDVADVVGGLLKHYTIIVDKSTVPVGTSEKVRERIAQHATVPFDVVSNPEFLREGLALQDFMEPDRIVIGTSSPQARALMEELYQPFISETVPLLVMDERSAEMSKYAANAFLAMKISFMNEIANVSERLHADVENVRLAIGADERIGKQFLHPGPGFGGSCFPKDALALERTAQAAGYSFHLMAAVRAINVQQKLLLYQKAVNYYQDKGQIKDKVVALWGLAFKPDTDDIREAPALTIIEQLLKAGATIQASDPEAIDNTRRFFKDETHITFFQDQYEALKGADALIIVTDWEPYRAPDFEVIKQSLRTPVIFDGRNLYDPKQLKDKGFYYESLGREIVQQ
jgi:UDPglucose 6-dehydrogenase